MSKIVVSSIEGNRQKLDGGAMFGNAPKAIWEKWIAPDEVNRIQLSCRSLLIEVEGKKILCEAGVGAFFEPRLAERFGVEEPGRHLLLENLSALGIEPADIDYVILSHLHFDHAGGVLPTFEEIQAGNKGLVFPNAHFIVGKEALERAKKPHFRDRASFIPDLPAKLEATNRLQIVTGNKADGVFEDRLSFFQSSGHTPGQMHTVFKGDDNPIVFVGDLIPGTHWVHLPLTMGYDRFPERLIEEKERLFKDAVPGRWVLFYTHDPYFNSSRVLKNERGRYVAADTRSELVRHPL